MKTKQTIAELWIEFRDAIDKAYRQADTSKGHDSPALNLRDYANNVSWSDSLRALLDREIESEKQHRRGHVPAIKNFSIDTAAKLLLMQYALRGAQMTEMPSAVDLLVHRKTAVEAEVIGFLIKKHLSREWEERLGTLDYAALMSA
jgi:hypothetical protein